MNFSQNKNSFGNFLHAFSGNPDNANNILKQKLNNTKNLNLLQENFIFAPYNYAGNDYLLVNSLLSYLYDVANTYVYVWLGPWTVQDYISSLQQATIP